MSKKDIDNQNKEEKVKHWDSAKDRAEEIFNNVMGTDIEPLTKHNVEELYNMFRRMETLQKNTENFLLKVLTHESVRGILIKDLIGVSEE